ncbi:putative superfamily III holin-X [Nonomuraea polychroma]|uniref:Putative superfamily III holin-X n=1 Tax=Nonomuraea polychroma TaxID=46176 RepID=A0A438MHN6_9ACTN|nr:phage holin family protein [Nonomuraea polychroma]RVX44985.1 putative superfamily III holin-X [Nonomuraea polychroma]
MSTVQPPADGGPGTVRKQESPPVSELIKQASEQVSVLVRQEIRLAAAEMKDKGRYAGLGAGLLGAAALVALYGAAALLAAVIAALTLVMPAWVAALIAAVVLLAVAAVLGLTGRTQVTHAMPPLPEQAIDSTRQDVTEIKERARR